MRTILLFTLLAATPAFAQSPAPVEPPPPAPIGTPAADDALRGPRLKAEDTAPTLVAHDFMGHLKKLDTPPEVAALRLLDLDESERKKTGDILTARAAILDRVVIENIDLLVQLHNASESGDKAEKVRLLRIYSEKLESLRERGPLDRELASALPKDKAARLKSLVGDYRAALAQDISEEAKKAGETLRPTQVTNRIYFQELGAEIKQSYERQIATRSADLERVLGKLNLSPELEGKIRKQIAEYAQETKLNATPAQKRKFLLAILAQLNPEQQKILLEETRGRPESPER